MYRSCIVKVIKVPSILPFEPSLDALSLRPDVISSIEILSLCTGADPPGAGFAVRAVRARALRRWPPPAPRRPPPVTLSFYWGSLLLEFVSQTKGINSTIVGFD